MRHLIKGLFLGACLLAVQACDTSWDYDYDYEEDRTDRRQNSPVVYETAIPPQMTADRIRTQVRQKNRAEKEPLPLQGPCASWEPGCYVNLRNPEPSFSVTEGPCMMKYGPYGMTMTGRCQKKPPEKEPEKPVRSHCFRNNNWETCR